MQSISLTHSQIHMHTYTPPLQQASTMHLHMHAHTHFSTPATMILNEGNRLSTTDDAHFSAEADRGDTLSHTLVNFFPRDGALHDSFSVNPFKEDGTDEFGRHCADVETVGFVVTYNHCIT